MSVGKRLSAKCLSAKYLSVGKMVFDQKTRNRNEVSRSDGTGFGGTDGSSQVGLMTFDQTTNDRHLKIPLRITCCPMNVASRLKQN
jgi:hypothetical protein